MSPSSGGGAAVDALKESAQRNRGSYRRLRKELEELTDHGLLMLKSLQRPDANVMQRLAVQVLCKQLDQAWTYFNRSWKMQGCQPAAQCCRETEIGLITGSPGLSKDTSGTTCLTEFLHTRFALTFSDDSEPMVINDSYR